MKKLLGILVLGLLWCNQAISIEEKYLQQLPGLFRNLQVCTVYYKFLARSVERATDLTVEQKQYAINMHSLSKEAEVKTWVYATELNKYQMFDIKIKDIQNNAENIYNNLLKASGGDYSKTDILKERYEEPCGELIHTKHISTYDFFAINENETKLFIEANKSLFSEFTVTYDFSLKTPNEQLDNSPKKLTASNVSELVKNSKSLKGKKLFCRYSDDELDIGLDFKTKNKVQIVAINEDEERIITFNGKYNAMSDTVKINFKDIYNEDKKILINRKNLTIKYSPESSCYVLKKGESVKDKLEIILNKIIAEKSSENKF